MSYGSKKFKAFFIKTDVTPGVTAIASPSGSQVSWCELMAARVRCQKPQNRRLFSQFNFYNSLVVIHNFGRWNSQLGPLNSQLRSRLLAGRMARMVERAPFPWCVPCQPLIPKAAHPQGIYQPPTTICCWVHNRPAAHHRWLLTAILITLPCCWVRNPPIFAIFSVINLFFLATRIFSVVQRPGSCQITSYRWRVWCKQIPSLNQVIAMFKTPPLRFHLYMTTCRTRGITSWASSDPWPAAKSC